MSLVCARLYDDDDDHHAKAFCSFLTPLALFWSLRSSAARREQNTTIAAAAAEHDETIGTHEPLA